MKPTTAVWSILVGLLGLAAAAAGYVAVSQSQRASEADRDIAALAGTATAASVSAQASLEAQGLRLEVQQATAEADAVSAQATQAALSRTAAEQSMRADALAAMTESQRLAYLAVNVPANEPAVAQLLSIEAVRIEDTAEARQALWHGVSSHPDWLSRIGPQAYLFAYSPDGGTLVTTHVGGVLRVWDIRDLTRPRLLGEAQTDEIGATLDLLFSPDGTRLYHADYDSRLLIWDLSDPAAPTQLGEVVGMPGLASLDVDPIHNRLATGHDDGSVMFWDLADGATPRQIGTRLQAHPSPIDDLAFRADGEVLATAGGPGDRFALWDVQDPAAPVRLSEPDFAGKGDLFIEDVEFSPNGAQLALTRSETVMVWDVAAPAAPSETGQWIVPDSVVYDIAYSPDGQALAAVRADGSISLLNPTSLEVTHTRLEPEGAAYAVAYQPGSAASLAVANIVGQVTLFDATASGAATRVGSTLIALEAVPEFALYSPTGTLLAIEQVGRVELWDVQLANSPVRAAPPLTMDSLIMTGVFAPDGRWLATADYAGDLLVWDVADPRAPVRLAQPESRHGITVRSLAVSADGRLLASGDNDGIVMLWDMTDPAAPRWLSEPTADNNGVHTLAFTADASRLLAASWDRRVHVWDVGDPAAPTVWGEPIGQDVQSLAYDPERDLLITGDDAGRLAFWNLTATAPATAIGEPMPALSEAISDLVYLPASGVLAVGDQVLGAVQLWDLGDPAQPIPYATLPLPEGAFRGFAGRPDGAELALWGFDAPLTVVDVGPAALAERACRLAGRNLTGSEWRRYFGEQAYRATCDFWPSGEALTRLR